MAELVIRSLSHKYGKHWALRGVDAALHDGIVALIGPNGAGKTTLIRAVVGLLQPTDGEIFLNGSRIESLGRQYYTHIGYCPQALHFYPNFTAEDFLLYMGAMKGMPRQPLQVRIPALLEQVNLLPQRKDKIRTFSGGMKQRLGIAQALLDEPDVLVLDEPTAGLDPCERTRFRNMLSRLSEGRIILIAPHIISDVESIANQVLFLKEGAVAASGTPEQVLSELDGQVWRARGVDADTLERISAEYVVSNVCSVPGNRYDVKILGDAGTDPAFSPESASLEDAFLYHYSAAGKGTTQCTT
ncbi:MAG: ATP-binding cassette domain-containing protein [Firmicutes bacterium]|nr:ATP-binding cassette domain-containing protein [Bacillota bacterium]